MNAFRKIKLWHLRRKRRAAQKRAARIERERQSLSAFFKALSVACTLAVELLEQQNQKLILVLLDLMVEERKAHTTIYFTDLEEAEAKIEDLKNRLKERIESNCG